MTAVPWRLACSPAAWRAVSGPMPISSEDLHRALDGPGWSMRSLARRLEMDDGSMRRIARGSSSQPFDNLGAWLKAIGAIWAVIPVELHEVARQMGCDRGKFVRRPRGFRPLTDEEAAQLEVLAAFHRALPLPIGWQSVGKVEPETQEMPTLSPTEP